MSIKHHLLSVFIIFSISQTGTADTRETILSMEKACTGKLDPESPTLKKLQVQCRPYVDHGGSSTPDKLDGGKLSAAQQAIVAVLEQYSVSIKQKNVDSLGSVLTEDFSIIQPGGNAWNKETYLTGGVAHVIAMFKDLTVEMEPVRIYTADQAATVIAKFRLGGLHMGKPATTFGLGTIGLVKIADDWKIQHIHNSGMQVY